MIGFALFWYACGIMACWLSLSEYAEQGGKVTWKDLLGAAVLSTLGLYAFVLLAE